MIDISGRINEEIIRFKETVSEKCKTIAEAQITLHNAILLTDFISNDMETPICDKIEDDIKDGTNI